VTALTIVASPTAEHRDAAQSDARDLRAAELLEMARSASESERRSIHQRVVLDYLEVAEAVARRYRSHGQDWDDVRQVAFVGLTKAVMRFEPSRGVGLVSFAVPTVAGEIKRHLRDRTWTVRPPRRLQELHLRLDVANAELAQALGRTPTVAELAAHLGEPRAMVAEALDCRQSMRPASLDAERGEDGPGGDTTTLADSLGVEDDGYARAELLTTLRRACRTLTPRERRILYLRFTEERTQEEIAREIGVTQMQVSRLLTKILATLRARIGDEEQRLAS